MKLQQNIADEIQPLITEWDVENKIHIAVIDNGPNLVNAFVETAVKIVPCAVHTLQLVINDCKNVHGLQPIC